MHEPRRVSGYVIAGDQKRKESAIVWKVRVKDEKSTFNDRKLVVASVHSDIALAKGLNVTFFIGSVDGPKGQKVHRAVDVMLLEANGQKGD